MHFFFCEEYSFSSIVQGLSTLIGRRFLRQAGPDIIPYEVISSCTYLGC
jgi:hypothetical protein